MEAGDLLRLSPEGIGFFVGASMTSHTNSHTTFVVGLSGGLGKSLLAELRRRSFTILGSFHSRPLPEAGFAMDLCDPASILSVSRELKNRNVALDSLVLNAGLSVLGPQLAIGDHEYERAFRVNFFGPREVIRAFLPLMKPEAKILIVGSVASWGSLPYGGAYSLSKLVARSFAEILGQELSLRPETRGIRVVHVEPGAYATGIWKSGVDGLERTLGKNSRFPALLAKLARGSSDPAHFGRKITAILERKRPRIYYRFGAFSLLSRLSSFVPFSFRVRVLRGIG